MDGQMGQQSEVQGRVPMTKKNIWQYQSECWMESGTRCPQVSVCEDEMVRGAAAPKGPMTQAFTNGEFSLFFQYSECEL